VFDIQTATAFLVSLTLGLAIAQEKTEDPHGWTKAKWGMTQEEIQKVFPDAAQISDRTFGQMLGLRKMKVGTLDYTVRFRFSSGSAALAEVLLSPEGDPALYAEAAETELLPRLTDKYGAPTKSSEEDLDEGKRRKWEWIFSETDLTLSFSEYRDRRFNFTLLTYHKREKSDAL
jgi:hypothetical protein